MLYWVYRVFGTAFFFLLFLIIPLISLVRPGAARSLRGRMGSVQPVSGKKGATLWIHAASVGEVQAAGVLINELLSGGDEYNIVLTTMTEFGLKVSEAQLSGNVSCFLVPLDVPYAVRRFLGTIRPDMYIGLETELWPALLTEIRLAGVPGVLINGRMSQRSFKRYRLVQGLLKKLLSGFSAISVIRNIDKERFAFFGIPEDRILVTGNIKYDFTPEDQDVVRKKYRALLGLKDEKLFICGSTRSGEEKILVEVFRQLREQSGRELVWLVAPRHLERLAEVKRLLDGYGLSYDLFTELKDKRKERESSVVLVDSMGELARIYSAGDYIFCGGSLVDKGGHNVMEAARWGMPVYYGPSMYDFMDAAELLENGGAGFRVADGDELVRIIVRHMDDEPEYKQAGNNALEVMKLQQGSARRQADIVRKLLLSKQH